MKEDIVIIGSSRAQHHYIPELITKKTGLSCYNIGRDGMRMLYYETIFNAMLDYHKPKIIILDLTFGDLGDEANDKALTAAAVLPFLNENKALEDQIHKNNKPEYYKGKLSVLYRVNSLPLSVLQHHLGFGSKTYSGYKPLYGGDLKISKMSFWNNKDYKEPKDKLKAFENIVKISKAKNIKLYVVISPALEIPVFNAERSANRILSKFGLKSYSYAQLFNIKQRDFFHDPGHLNNIGAEIFTDRLISDLFLQK
jgi:hypothetical protein